MNLKPKYTPGPWRVMGKQKRTNQVDELIIGATVEGGIDVATAFIPIHGKPEFAQANANLVATAPELLFGLERTLELLQGIHDLLPGEKPEWNKLEVILKDVIARARGSE